ncbi:MAG: cell division protein ZapB [Acidobacteria bacterium]|nr:cell division protein ZapB [Acidobacteriota bacterium]
MAKTSTPGVELEPIDRLEEKLKLLISVVERLKDEQAQASEENARLKAEVESLRSRVAAGETLSGELTVLREERDLIRSRVGEMLSQLDALEL